MNGLAIALAWAATLAANERNPAEAARSASDLIELSTRHNFVSGLAIGAIYRGWARSASGNAAEGILWQILSKVVYRGRGASLLK